MNPETKRKWYQMKRVWLAGAVVGVGLLSSYGDSPVSPTIAPSLVNTPQYQQTLEKQSQGSRVIPVAQSVNNEVNNLSNDNYYTNSVGNTVHSPAYSEGGNIPAGASAQCRDGTYSFSQSRSGTCSRHGGVSIWY